MIVKLKRVLRRPVIASAALAAVLVPVIGMPQAAVAQPADAPRQIVTFVDKCVTVRDGSVRNDIPIVQYQCESSIAQRFRFVPVSATEYQIVTFANKCLTVEGGDVGNGVPIMQDRCVGSFAQRFRIVALTGSQYQIETFADKCLTVDGDSPDDNVPIVQFECGDMTSQVFRFFPPL